MADRAVLARWLAVRDGSGNTIADFQQYASIRRGEELQICVAGAAGLAPPVPPGAPKSDTVVMVFPSTGRPILGGMGPRGAVLDVFEQLRALPGTQDVE